MRVRSRVRWAAALAVGVGVAFGVAPAVIGEFASGKRGGIDQPTRAKAVANFAPRTAGQLRDDGTPVEADLYDLGGYNDLFSQLPPGRGLAVVALCWIGGAG